MPSPLRVKLVNLASFDYDDPYAAKITSPRSLEACIKAGVDPDDLVKKYVNLAFKHNPYKEKQPNLFCIKYTGTDGFSGNELAH